MGHATSWAPPDWPAAAEEHADAYRAAQPWPHLVVEGLVDPQLVAAAEREEIGPALQLRPHRSHREIKAETPVVSGPATRAILAALAESTFVDFLSRLTGVQDLQVDPTHAWAGLHVGAPGAFQAVHRDFRRHPVTKAFHRLNVLVYLNSDWSETFGGQLELWPPDLRRCGRTITPSAGRMVIFETTPSTLHGVPDPVRCPPGRARLTLASYYYTDRPGPDDRPQARFWRPRRPQDPFTTSIPGLSDALGQARRVIGQLRHSAEDQP